MCCPHCQTENPDGTLWCIACHRRSFAWLGDPFGNLEPPVQAVAFAAAGSPATAIPDTRPEPLSSATLGQRIREISVERLISAGVVLVVLFQVSAGWTALAAVLVVGMLWQRPRMSGRAFTWLMVGVLVAVPSFSVCSTAPSAGRTRPPATAMAQARAGTRSSTSGTVTPRPSGTATARAAAAATGTAQANAAAQALATTTVVAASAEKRFGPAGGTMDHQEDGQVRLRSARVDLRDFIAEVRFQNPYERSLANWDYGLFFRRMGTDQHYLLYVSAEARWMFSYQEGKGSGGIATGTVHNFDTVEAGSNLLRLVVKGDAAYFFVNGEYVATLHLARNLSSGDVMVATGAMRENQVNGKSTRYEGFTVWALPETPASH